MNSLRDKILLVATLSIIILTVGISMLIIKKIEITNINENDSNYSLFSTDIKSELLYEEKITSKIIEKSKNNINNFENLISIDITSVDDNYSTKKFDDAIKHFSFLYMTKEIKVSTSTKDYMVKALYKKNLATDLNKIIFIDIAIFAIWTLIITIVIILNRSKNKNTCNTNKSKTVEKEKENLSKEYVENESEKNSVIELNFGERNQNDDLNQNINLAMANEQNSTVIFLDLSKIDADSFFEIKQTLSTVSENIYLLSGAISIENNSVKITIPNITIADAYQIANRIISTAKEIKKSVIIPCGITSRNERIMNAIDLLNEAEKALIKSKLEDNEIICFNADKEKFDAYNAQK